MSMSSWKLELGFQDYKLLPPVLNYGVHAYGTETKV